MRTLHAAGYDVIGLDIKPSPFTTVVGSVSDRSWVKHSMAGVDTVYHVATLHKPHVATHSMQDFVDTNVSGTLSLLEEAISVGICSTCGTAHTLSALVKELDDRRAGEGRASESAQE